MLTKQSILEVAKEIFPEYRTNPHWFDSLEIDESATASLELIRAVKKKNFYKNIDLLSIMKLGYTGQMIVEKHPHDKILNLLMQKSIIDPSKKRDYENIDLVSILKLGIISVKLIEKYSIEKIIELMIEDSVFEALSKNGDPFKARIEMSSGLYGLVKKL